MGPRSRAGGPPYSAAVLDLWAEALHRSGRQASALQVLGDRLRTYPTTTEAYRAYAAIEAEIGLHEELDTFVDGQKLTFGARPQIINGRTLFPVLALTQRGLTATWDGANLTATVGAKTLTATVGSATANVNGQVISLDTPMQAAQGEPLVPLRALAEVFGYSVMWDPAVQVILLFSPA